MRKIMVLDNFNNIIDSFKGKPWQYRLKIVDHELPLNWSRWLINPSGLYIETENFRPVLISEVEWIEINPIENKKNGKLLPDKIIDHSSVICQNLDKLNVEYSIDSEIIKIKTAP